MTQQTRAQKRDMTKGAIMPHVFRMSAPMVIGIGSIISFSLADTYFIGQLGATELAAIGYTFPVTTMFFNLIFGMAIAMSAVVSRKVGAGLMDDVRKTATIGLMIVFLFSCFMAVMGYMFMGPIFKSMGAGDDVMPIIREYMSIWFFGAIFLSIPVVANSAIRGMGDAFWPAVVMVSVAVVNIILDPILIFGLFGAPRLEVQGAAIASLIAYIVSMCGAMSIIIFREKLLAPLCLVCAQSWRVIAKPLLVIAIPVSLANVIAPVISYGYTMILSDLGDEAVAGFGVAMRFEAFALIPIMAIAGGMAPLIGQNYGAGLYDRVNEALSKALKFGVIYGLGCAVVMAIIAKPVATVFSDDKIVRDFVAHYMIMVPISFVGLNVFLVTTSSMNAMDRARTALSLNFIKSFGVALPAAYLFTNSHGEIGFLGAIIVTNIAAAVCAGMYLKRLYCKV
jgi:putative MATE family efflux protein